MNNKKGATLVEASLIFPLVIAAVMAVIYIIILIYESFSLQSSLHLFLRDQSSQLSDTIYREEELRNYEINHEFHSFRPIITGEEVQKYKAGNLIINEIMRTEKGRFYVIDEAEFIRKASLIKEVL